MGKIWLMDAVIWWLNYIVHCTWIQITIGWTKRIYFCYYTIYVHDSWILLLQTLTGKQNKNSSKQRKSEIADSKWLKCKSKEKMVLSLKYSNREFKITEFKLARYNWISILYLFYILWMQSFPELPRYFSIKWEARSLMFNAWDVYL